MAALGAQSIASSYEQLLHVDADGGGNGTTHVSLKDGDNGTTFPLTLATDAVMVTSTNRLEFGDNASYIHQSADGVLDLVSDTEIELTATTIDINGAVEVSGNVRVNDANYALEGYGTGRNIIRSTIFTLSPGATPGTNINISASDAFNSPSVTNATNLAKSGTSGSFALSSDGLRITMDITAVIVGDISVSIGIHDVNSSSTSEMYFVDTSVSSGNLLFDTYKRGVQARSDLTGIMDAGDQLFFQVTYITSS